MCFRGYRVKQVLAVICERKIFYFLYPPLDKSQIIVILIQLMDNKMNRRFTKYNKGDADEKAS
jgi:hypothetical protein